MASALDRTRMVSSLLRIQVRRNSLVSSTLTLSAPMEDELVGWRAYTGKVVGGKTLWVGTNFFRQSAS